MKIKYVSFITLFISFSTIFTLIFDIGKITTTIIIPLGFIFYLLIKQKKVKYILKIKEFKVYGLFLILTFSSILYADFIDAALITNKRIFIVSIFAFTIFSYTIDSLVNIYKVYFSFLIVLIIMLVYAYINGIFNTSYDRVEIETVNANTFGYYIFIGLFSAFMILSMNKRTNYLWISLVVLLSIISVIVIQNVASRGSLIIITLLLFGNFYFLFQNYKKQSYFNFLKSVSIILFLIYLGNFIFLNYFKESVVIERFSNLENVESPREYHVQKAIEIGLSNPILGIGSGNYAKVPKTLEQGSFSHNTYTEIFANYGLIGLIFYSYFIYLICKRIIRLSNITKYQILIHQISWFLFLYLIYNLFYVTYLTAEFTGILFIIISHLILIEKITINQ